MKLSTRLVVWFTVLLLGAITVLGLAVGRWTTTILTRQVDTELAAVADRGGPLLQRATEETGRPQLLRGVAVLILSEDGTVERAVPAGFSDEPDPLPYVDGIDLTVRRLTTVPAESGGFDYRVLTVPLRDGRTVVVGVPLHQVADAQRNLNRAMAVTGAFVVIAGAAGIWLLVHREMRPVEDMVETAEAIAAGDLTRRVPEAEADTELGRLAGSLNEMLGHIESAIETERDAQERLRRFVADASHELRTPISAISGYAQLHRQGALEAAEDLEKAMTRIESESGRMESLVHDLLLLARLDRTDPPAFRAVDVKGIAASVADDARAIEPDRPVTLTMTDSPAVVHGDHEQLFGALANLVTNARVHTPAGTPVHVSVDSTDDTVTVTVADEGPGFPPESVGKVFERFYRADPSRSRARGGSGLGLAIVAAVAQAHQGSVSAANAPDGGAVVTISLPVTST